ncbi:MAG: UDP-N-acetylmuramate--L-alanine ligase, partial [Saprospiraceae bacterium]|nr:UDP-N-acetylmuramate--L-alanine ligase [Saprospiraceae bacterium]
DLKYPLPGRHNIENATAAIAIARHLGVSDAAIREGLSTFKGIQRRFELIYQDQSVTFFDDYAHHPSELKAAIGAAKELFPNKRITGVFQPHLFSRTRDFAAGFAEALDKLDALILLDIYPAREEPIPGITADTIRDLMQNKSVLRGTKDDVPKLLENENIEVLLTLGAGDISRRIKPIQSFLESRKVNV